jgi:hypothetical protein
MSNLNMELFDLIYTTLRISSRDDDETELIAVDATLAAMVYIRDLEEALEHLQGTVKRQYVGT